MYSNKLVCSVKVGRKILREKVENNESTVFIPFGSEYSLMFKNLGGRNAIVNIEIDGRKVCESGFYIRAGQTADIERFVESLVEGRRFKFIEKTEEISNFRGDKIDDGIIRVTWQFEKPVPEVKEVRYNYKHDHLHNYHSPWCGCPWCRPQGIWYGPITYGNTSVPLGSVTYASNIGSAISGGRGGTQTSCFNANVVGSNVDAPGITVEGSKSFQSFGTTYAGELEPNVHSMVILLKGFDGSKKYIKDPICVKHKRECPSCGKKWKNAEYCGKCSTALTD